MCHMYKLAATWRWLLCAYLSIAHLFEPASAGDARVPWNTYIFITLRRRVTKVI